MRDCVFLLADGTMETVFRAFLVRNQAHQSLGCGAFAFDPRQDLVVDAGGNDPGVFTRAHEFLDRYRTTHRFAVVVLDAAWEGSPGANAIANKIAERLTRSGWEEHRVAVRQRCGDGFPRAMSTYEDRRDSQLRAHGGQ